MNNLLILFTMSKVVASIKWLIEFVTNRIWKIRLNKVSKGRGFVIKQLRVISLSIKGFQEDNALVSATALTFYTIFSIVPILALVFAVAQGFGFELKHSLQDSIVKKYPQYNEILDNAFNYANDMLSNTKGGIIAGIGIVLLLWSVMKLLISIENSFNQIWEIRNGRSWVRKITDYLTIMMVGPLLLIVSGGITVAIQNGIGNLHLLGFIGTFLINLLAYSLVALSFTFLFYVMPNTKVNFKPAFSAAVISTILFELLGWAYVKFQIGANSMNAIYGSFAALPLFLIWLQYSWYIVLFGAELAYANQYVDHYELEEDIQNLSMRYKKVLSLMIANLVAKRFYEGEKSMNLVEISEKLDLPSRLTKNLINEFLETGIFVEVRTDADKELNYQPGVTETKFTVQYIIDTLDRKGVNSLPINDSKELLHINELMKEMDKLMDTQTGHMLVKDLVK